MLQTIYKTRRPENLERTDRPEDFADAEYRQVFLRASEGQDAVGKFIVRVSQGWWNDAAKTPIHARQLFEEKYDSWDQAHASYQRQVQHLVEEGFVHSFTVDPESETGRRYENLDAPVPKSK